MARADRPLALVPTATDRLMNAEEIAREKWFGKKSARWVRQHHPGRLPGSREALYFESAVDEFVARIREATRRRA